MTNNIEKRPAGCYYKGLWDLYVKLKSLKEPLTAGINKLKHLVSDKARGVKFNLEA